MPHTPLPGPRDWRAVFSMPARYEMNHYSNPDRIRAPYLCAWLYPPEGAIFREYSVDFRAEHVPEGTYCSLANWFMDLSGLQKKGLVCTKNDGGIHAYAGFQRIARGQMVSIMSFWDLPCKDGDKNVTLRARRVYPDAAIDGDEFGGEGTGTRCSVPCDWVPGRWYRMTLRAIPDRGRNTTFVEQWITDLQTGRQTLQSRIDTLLPDSAFKDPVGIFLENFLWETAGQLRTLEVCNPRFLPKNGMAWQPFRQAHIGAQSPMLPTRGSYAFGVDRGHIWMITTGIGLRGQKAGWYDLDNKT